MPTTPSQPENYFQFEKLLVALVRATDDVDIIIRVSPENIQKLLQCLSLWGEGWSRELNSEDFRPRLRYLDTGGVRIPYLALEDLLFLKQGSWREKDQIDVAALRRMLG